MKKARERDAICLINIRFSKEINPSEVIFLSNFSITKNSVNTEANDLLCEYV